MRRHVSCKVSTNKRISLDSSLAAQELQKPSPALVEGRSRSIPVGTAAGRRRAPETGPLGSSRELVRALRRALRARKALLVLREHAYMMYLSKVLTHGASTKHAMLSDHVSGHMTTRRTHMLLHGQTDR